MRSRYEPHHGTPSLHRTASAMVTASVSATRPDRDSSREVCPSAARAECGWRWASEFSKRGPAPRADAAIFRAPTGTRDLTSPRSPRPTAGGCTSLPVCGSYSFPVLTSVIYAPIGGARAIIYRLLWHVLATPVMPGNLLLWMVSGPRPSGGRRRHSSPMKK